LVLTNYIFCKSIKFFFVSEHLFIFFFFLSSISCSCYALPIILFVSRPGVSFINILHAHFLYESELKRFSLIMFGFVIFGDKILYKKCLHKTLMKLTAASSSRKNFVNSVSILICPFSILRGPLEIWWKTNQVSDFLYFWLSFLVIEHTSEEKKHWNRRLLRFMLCFYITTWLLPLQPHQKQLPK